MGGATAAGSHPPPLCVLFLPRWLGLCENIRMTQPLPPFHPMMCRLAAMVLAMLTLLAETFPQAVARVLQIEGMTGFLAQAPDSPWAVPVLARRVGLRNRCGFSVKAAILRVRRKWLHVSFKGVSGALPIVLAEIGLAADHPSPTPSLKGRA